MNRLLQTMYKWFTLPHRLAAIRPFLRTSHPRVLDIGCGNHSPKVTKRYYPHCTYHGVDNRRWNRDDEDDRQIDQFFNIDLETPGCLSPIPAGFYDAVICSHVLEHLAQPYALIGSLAAKLAPGGVLLIEVPAPKSTRLPRAGNGWLGVRGCLNFYDDDTHKTMVDLARVGVLLRDTGLATQGPVTSILWRRVLFLPLYLAAVLIAKGFVPASLLWDVTGFAHRLTGVAPGRRAHGGQFGIGLPQEDHP
jgi:SAM-dependent methyltransferase